MKNGRRIQLRILLLAIVPLTIACGDDISLPWDRDEETISRDTFISTYVDLRLAALREDPPSIQPEERERILERNGVTADELLRFVDVHADRADFMEGVWQEVGERIEPRRTGGDTTARPERVPPRRGLPS